MSAECGMGTKVALRCEMRERWLAGTVRVWVGRRRRGLGRGDGGKEADPTLVWTRAQIAPPLPSNVLELFYVPKARKIGHWPREHKGCAAVYVWGEEGG